MTSKMAGRVLTLVALLFNVGGAVAQTYTQMQWGMNKGATPYQFGANINGSWTNLGTVSAAGVWAISSSNISGIGTAAAQNIGTSGANVPLLNGANTWSAIQTFSGGITNLGSISPLNYISGLSASADNGPTIQAAVNACPSTGCALVIPYGAYPVATSITLKAGVVIQGQGSAPGYKANTRLYNSGLSGPMFIFPGSASLSPGVSTSIGLRDFTIDMQSANYAAVSAPEITSGRGTWNGNITHMSIVNARPALDIVNGWDWWINDNAFIACGNAATGAGRQKACLYISNSTGSYSGAASNSIHIVDNFIDTSVGEGINIDSSLGSSTKVNSMFITGNHFGIQGYSNISGCISNSVIANNVSEGTIAGQAIFNLSGLGTGCAFNIISNNSLNAPGAYSIVDANTSDLIANNFNYIKGTNTAWYSLTAASGNITVIGNKSDDNPCCNTIPMVTDAGSLNSVQWNDGSDGVISSGLVPFKKSGTSYSLLTSAALALPITISGAATFSSTLKLASYTIAGLPTCNAAALGVIVTVSNGTAYATGTYGSAVSATGAVTRQVLCTNTAGATTYAWAYN